MQKIYSHGIKEKLVSGLKHVLLQVADWIENIPIIGVGIANAIKTGITMSEMGMTQTLEDTTTSSIETAKTKINQSATEAGGEAGTNWMSEMKNKINSEKTNLETTIETTVTGASDNSQATAQDKGGELGNNYINGTKESIQLSKEELGNTIKQVTTNATNSNTSNVSQSGRKLGNKTIEGIKQGETSQTGSLSSTTSQVVNNANSNVNTSSANSIGKNIISGIKLGITGNSWSLYSAITTLGNTLLSKFKTAMGIHSPSKEMASLAKFIPLGIAEGIDSTSDKAISSMKSLVTDIEDTASNMDVQYNIPKISKDAISYVPSQAISTNEIQRSIIGNDDILSKILSNTKANHNKEYTFNLYMELEGEIIRKTIKKKDAQELFATNGGGL